MLQVFCEDVLDWTWRALKVLFFFFLKGDFFLVGSMFVGKPRGDSEATFIKKEM